MPSRQPGAMERAPCRASAWDASGAPPEGLASALENRQLSAVLAGGSER